ncbi:MAG TPA: amino acid permease [Steroidobacteraceae bacterium]|nr:amino acid permease [Steroidobacteraceae bacterium]
MLATALVASNMIGSGIFLLPATLATVGSITVIGWAIGTVGALLIGAILAKLSRVAPQPGGPCAYAGEALGPYFGFQANALYWLSCWIGNIAIALAAMGYLANFVPALNQPVPGAVATVGFIWVMSAVNILGPRLVCQIESLAIVVGLVPILLVAIGGWWYFDGRLFMDSWNVRHEPAMRVIPQSLVLLFWAFTGLESASVASAVVDNPGRNVAIATLGGVLIAALVYISSCTVLMGLIPAAELARSSAPFADAVRLVLGPVAAGVIALSALIKATGTLGGWILLTAQTGKAGADHGLFPGLFGRVDRHDVPASSLLLMAAVMSAVVFATISPTLGEQFGELIEVSVIFCMMLYVYACIAVLVYPRWIASARSLERYRPMAAVALLFCLVVIGYAEPKLLLLTAATMLLTLPLYLLFARSWIRSI